MKARNPWSIILTRPIAPQIFDFIRKVVIKSKSKFGLSFCADNQEDTFSFTNMKRAVTDLSKLAAVPRTDIENYYFSRKSKGSKKGDIVTEKKPFKVVHDNKRKEAKIISHYAFENEFGYVFCSLTFLELKVFYLKKHFGEQ